MTATIEIADKAGSVVDLSQEILEVNADGIEDGFANEKGSKNLITYQGDLNYDGRVSMKDLAYLNAGAARANAGGGVAADVDANYDEKIDLADLAILDEDWGKSLHTRTDKGFTGSDSLDWDSLDQQGSTTWDNTAFKDQNALEAQDGFVGSLETVAGVNSAIGADGNLSLIHI